MNSIDSIMTALKIMREVKADFTSDQVMTFLLAAKSEEGVTIDDLMSELGQTKSSASRNLKILDPSESPSSLGLLDIMLDRTNTRIKRRILSPKGKALLAKIQKATQG